MSHRSLTMVIINGLFFASSFYAYSSHMPSLMLEGSLALKSFAIHLYAVKDNGRVLKLLNTWPCKLDFTSKQGKRLVCGQSPYPIEFVYTPGERDAAGVYYTRVPDPTNENKLVLVRHFFACVIKEEAGVLQKASCEERFPKETKEESELLSPIKSTLSNVAVLNSHLVEPVDPEASGGKIIRGMAPKEDKHYLSLFDFGVTDVIVFKNTVKDDVTKEIEDWQRLQVKHQKLPVNVKQIPFKWKDHKGFRIPCRQTLRALRLIKTAVEDERNVFFHCTVGEDRTGFLAGVIRLLRENRSHRYVFDHELCDRGFERGNAFKPYEGVDLKIRESLTKLYLKFAYLIKETKEGALSWDNLADEVCQNDPANTLAFRQDASYNWENFKCDVSTRFRP